MDFTKLTSLSIGKKLVGMSLLLALFVLITGLVGTSMVSKVARSGDEIIEEKLPFKDVSMEAIISAQMSLNACKDYLLATTGLVELEENIYKYLEEFDMFLRMIKYGTESDEFKNSPAGEIYVKNGLDIVVPRGSDEMQALVQEIETYQKVFDEKAKELVIVHKNRTQYNFTYRDVNYDFPGFLYEAEKKHLEWRKDLNNAVEYDIDFKGEPDPTMCFYGAWQASFSTEDEELKKMLDRLHTLHTKVHSSVSKILSAPQEQRTSMLSRESRKFNNMEKGFTKLEEYAGEKIKAAEQHEQSSVSAMFIESEKMIKGLESLEEMADADMVLAQENSKKAVKTARATSIIIMICAVAAALILGTLMARSITKPLSRVVDFTGKMSDGDFSQTLDVDRKDEIGTLTNAMNNMITSLSRMFREVTGSVETMASSSKGLSSISEQMSSGSERTSGKANTVATAAEEMSANMNSVAAASEQASTNISMVASASEEMATTISEIAQNSEKARDITGKAVSQAKAASVKIDELGTAAKDIGRVTEAITEISEQTNLLSLNATIEAARAGEAGKGFAVVANEIKELAKQTTEATQEIKEKIAGIQGATSGAVEQIDEISNVIDDVNNVVSTIATAVDEQSMTTKEIAGNIAQAASGIQEVTENITQSSAVAGEITKNIVEVDQAANEMSNSSSQVKMSATELSNLAEQLKEMVGRFKVYSSRGKVTRAEHPVATTEAAVLHKHSSLLKS